MNGERLVRVVGPHFVAAVVIGTNDRCIETAPYLRWCKGKPAAELRETFARKGWRASIIDPQKHVVQL